MLASERLISVRVVPIEPFPPRMSKIGVVIDLAVHDIDLVRWLTGEDIAELHAVTRWIKAEREDVALLQMRTTSGILSQINADWLTPFRTRTVQVTTENAYFAADLITGRSTIPRLRPNGSYMARQLLVSGVEPLRLELDHFVDSAHRQPPAGHVRPGGIAQPGTGVECLESMEHVGTAV